MNLRGTFLSFLMRRLAHRWVRFYYSAIHHTGGRTIPGQGPILFVANHANSLIDPVMVSIAAERRVHFLAKAPMFEVPLFGAFLKALGMIPAYRQSDDASQVSRNMSSITAGAAFLVQGESVGIFPEGRSHDQARLEKIRSGAARIAVQAAKLGARNLTVIPLGINYERKERFRSAVWIETGRAIAVTPPMGEAPHDEKRWIRDLTEQISSELKHCVIHLDEPSWEPLVDDLESFFPPPNTSGNRSLAALQQRKRIADAFNHFHQTDPSGAAAVISKLQLHKQNLAEAGLDFRSGLLRSRRAGLFCRQALQFLSIILGLIPALAGTLHHIVPFWIVRAIAASVQSSGRSTLSLARLAFGLPIYLLWYGLVWWWMAERYFLPWVAWVWCAAMPFAGIFALRFWWRAREMFVRWWRELLIFFRPQQLKALRSRNEALRAELEAMAAEFRTVRGLKIEPRPPRQWRPIARRGFWALGAATVIFVGSIWALIHLRGSSLASDLGSQGPDLTAVSDRALRTQLAADEAALAAVIEGLEDLAKRSLSLREEFSRGDRSYYRVSDNDLVRQQLLAYLNYRTALLRMIWKYQEFKTISEEPLRARAFLVGYTAGVTLYNASTKLVNEFGRSPEAVRKLNEAEPSSGIPPGVFDMVRRNLRDPQPRRLLENASRQYRIYSPLFSRYALRARSPYALFHQTIAEKREAMTRSGLASIGPFLNTVEETAKQGKQTVYRTKSFVSTWIGDTKIREPRKGRGLIESEQLAVFRKKLRPGDILLERRNWFLSNAFLPGYWPHAAIYVGSREDLIRLGLDKDSRVAPHWKRFCTPDESGHAHVILESVSEGVIFSSMEHSIGGADSAAAVRPNLAEARIRECLARAFSHVGKPYDFEFDFFSSDKLVCTELVYRSYDGEIDFPLVNILGTRTMPAIELVRKCAKERGKAGAQLTFVAFVEGSEASGKAIFRGESEFTQTLQRPGLTWLQPR